MKWLHVKKQSKFLKQFAGLASPYWKSEDKWKAGALLAIIVAMNLGRVYVQVLVNLWINDFYNVLQSLDKTRFMAELSRFCVLAAAYIAQSVYMVYLSQMLQIRWRRWLTQEYLKDWLSREAYYRMQFAEPQTDNPDQRISEDINSFIEITLDLGTTLLSSVATLVSFLAILWQLSGTLGIPLGSLGTLYLPGYMVWAALIYSFVGTWLTMRIGNPLILLNFNQQRFEADFRFGMMRIRENSESVALYRGERQEQVHLRDRFRFVIENFWGIMRRQKRLSWLTNTYNQAAVVFPVLMAAPRFFAGQMKLGGLMQTAGAFGAVQGALSYLINSYTTIAKWHAVIDRLVGFSRSLEELKTLKLLEGVNRIHTADNALRTESLSVFLPNGKTLVDNLELHIEPGTRLLVTGPSGCGKSTLMRAMAGIWPFCKGTIILPERSSIMFLPQKPYLPLGTLRDGICYPNPEGYREEDLRDVLFLCGLQDLIGAMDKIEDWSQVLSLGEQQRVAFSRLMLRKPDYIFLDEATASLDEDWEAALYGLLRRKLPHAAVTSVGHRSSLIAWHTLKLKWEKEGTWVQSALKGEGPGDLQAP
jgi:vitamin B12/bleomycin/antimicrobial peptide transport system ATP-binding/permease protein